MKLRTGLLVSSLKGEETRQEREELKFREEMEARRVLFEEGDKYVLFEALVMCAWFQAVMPDWIANALIEGEMQVDSGELVQPGDLFGKDKRGKPARQIEASLANNEGDILQLLGTYRKQGGAFNSDEYLAAVNEMAEEKGVSRFGSREIQRVYKKNKPHLLGLMRGGPDDGYASGNSRFDLAEYYPRRSGRPPFG